MNKEKSLLVYSLLLMSLLVLLLRIYMTKAKTIKNYLKTISTLDNKQRAFIYAVAAHETGNFKSNLLNRYNNAFGMRPAKKRAKFYDAVTDDNYAIYSSVKKSVDDFMDWFHYHKKDIPTDVTQGVYFMKSKGYFEDSVENYLNGVKYWLNKYSYDN